MSSAKILALGCILAVLALPLFGGEPQPANATQAATEAKKAPTEAAKPEAPPIGAMPDIFGGPVHERRKLTGNWGGVRNKMAMKGIIAEIDLTTVYQHQAHGGAQSDSILLNTSGKQEGHNEVMGLGDIFMAFDTQKAGLWEGGIFKFRALGRFGDSLQFRSAGITPTNTLSVQPVDDLDEETFDITDLSYTHFIIPKFALFTGLFSTFDADLNPFAGSDRGKSDFMNFDFKMSATSLSNAPFKTFGGGFLAMPHKRLTLTGAVYSRSELSGRSPFDNVDDAGVAFEAYVSHEIGKLPGGHCFNVTNSWKSQTELDFDPRVLLLPPGLVPDRALPEKSGHSWSASYNFYQYFQVYKGGPPAWSILMPTARPKGWGMFLRAGISDGNPNPIKWSFAGGLSGDNPLRTQDRWGAGFFSKGISDEKSLGVLNIHDERGVEFFYNAEITPWCHITADVQYIDVGLPNANNSVVLGLRTKIDF